MLPSRPRHFVRARRGLISGLGWLVVVGSSVMARDDFTRVVWGLLLLTWLSLEILLYRPRHETNYPLPPGQQWTARPFQRDQLKSDLDARANRLEAALRAAGLLVKVSDCVYDDQRVTLMLYAVQPVSERQAWVDRLQVMADAVGWIGKAQLRFDNETQTACLDLALAKEADRF